MDNPRFRTMKGRGESGKMREIEKKKGTTRTQFHKLFKFEEEPPSQQTDQMNPTPEDNRVSGSEDEMTPFTSEQIKNLRNSFNPINEQLNNLVDEIPNLLREERPPKKTSSSGLSDRLVPTASQNEETSSSGPSDRPVPTASQNFEKSWLEMKDKLEEVAKQLKRIDQVGDYDRTKQSGASFTNLYNRYQPSTSEGRAHSDEVDLGKQARSIYKGLLKVAFQCHKQLASHLHDAQDKIWNGIFSKATIKRLMEEGEVQSSESIKFSPDGFIPMTPLTLPKKVRLRNGIEGVFKPKSKDDHWLWGKYWGSHKSEFICSEL